MSDYDPKYHHLSKLDRSEGQQRRYVRNGNRLLARLRDEFGFGQEFTVRDVQDALGLYTSDENSKEEMSLLRQSFNNLLQRKMLERDGNHLVISEDGRLLLEHLNSDGDEE